MNIDKTIIAQRKQILESASKQLKTEFFGLDTIIDKIISSVYAWYVFPELVNRPIIVNLWGMTGVGKTQVVRRLSTLLNFGDKFVEIQMDGTSTSNRTETIHSKLIETIDENTMGILLLDEMQRFRTVDEHGNDVKVERFQDVWTLLSDGKFSPSGNMLLTLESNIGEIFYYHQNFTDIDKKAYESLKYKLSKHTAKDLKLSLRLPNSIQEIMTWDINKLQDIYYEMENKKQDWLIDYSKLLIFVSGNLDSAFTGSTHIEDSDTDADFYHKITSQLSVTEIKQALAKRFKPEQISRLGGCHIIYPSISKLSYQQLIKSTCEKYITEISESTNITFSLNNEIFDIIYNNAVYPTQGTRPVFSAIHKIFSTGLVNVACWCLENNINNVTLNINESKKQMIAISSNQEFATNVDLDISEKKSKISDNMKTLVAVHEAGHALIYALLTKSAPIETKINASSFANGYMLPNEGLNTNNITTKNSLRNKIAIALAGMVAEEMLFGPDNRSNGCHSDIKSATIACGLYVRQYGYDGTISHINNEDLNNTLFNTDLDSTNTIIEQLLKDEKERVKTLLSNNFKYYKIIVDTLLTNITIDQPTFISLSEPFLELSTMAEVNNFKKQYENFNKS